MSGKVSIKENCDGASRKSKLPMPVSTKKGMKRPNSESDDQIENKSPMKARRQPLVEKNSQRKIVTVSKVNGKGLRNTVSSSSMNTNARQSQRPQNKKARRGAEHSKLGIARKLENVSTPSVLDQKGIEFEADESALQSILDNTGIEQPTSTAAAACSTAKQLPPRHTLAGMTTGTPGKGMFGKPQEPYKKPDFHKWCEEYIQRVSMYQAAAKRRCEGDKGNKTGIEFEADESALQSILDNTGIEQPTSTAAAASTAKQLPPRHTLAGMTTGTPGKGMFGKPQEPYKKPDFHKWCEEYIQRVSMYQAAAKRRCEGDKGNKTDTGYKFDGSRQSDVNFCGKYNVPNNPTFSSKPEKDSKKIGQRTSSQTTLSSFRTPGRLSLAAQTPQRVKSKEVKQGTGGDVWSSARASMGPPAKLPAASSYKADNDRVRCLLNDEKEKNEQSGVDHNKDIEELEEELKEFKKSSEKQILKMKKDHQKEIQLLLSATGSSPSKQGRTDIMAKQLNEKEEELKKLHMEMSVMEKPKFTKKSTAQVLYTDDEEEETDAETYNDNDPDWCRTPLYNKTKRRKTNKTNRLSDVVRCKCTKACTTRRCHCVKKGRKCGDYCRCGASCENKESGARINHE